MKYDYCASAPGNVFFFGEFAVIYGKPSILASVDKKTTVYLTERKDKKVVLISDAFGKAEAMISSSGLGDYKTDASELYNVLDFIGELVSRLDIIKGFEIRVSSEVPVNSGMSSSTAVFSAILKVLSEFSGLPIDNKEFFSWIYPHQVKVHGGKASGSEIVSSSVGGFNLVRKVPSGVDFESLGDRKFSVVIGDTKVSAPSSLTVGYHLPSMEKRFPEKVLRIFSDIEKVTLRAKSAILEGNFEAVGELMNENQKLLVELGVSHPKLDDCIYSALKAGALGAKLSGSGWGGIMVALCRPEDQKKVLQAILETGANAFACEIGGEGVRIE